MTEGPGHGWFARHIDLIYKIVLVALIGLWMVFPPHASRPSVAQPAATVLSVKGAP